MPTPTEFQKAWRRFRRNKMAFAGWCFIVLAALIAIGGYALAPDNAPDANTQFPDLALQPPGTSATLLPIQLKSPNHTTSWITAWLGGSPPSARLLPIDASSLQLNGELVYYRTTGPKGRLDSVPLLRLFYAVSDSISRESANYLFKNDQGSMQQVSSSRLLERWRSEPVLQTRYFVLGTDKYGRCMWSRLLLGFRVSLLVGLIAVAISLTIGLLLGMIGGYFGGRLDDFVMLLINTIWSIPTLLLVFAIVLALGRGIGIIFLAVGLTMWVDVARIVRGQTIALRALPFVEAAKSMGIGHWRILRRHILPNLLGPVLVVAAGNFATAILLESGLSFLGFGVQPPTPSWGTMLHENYGYALGGKPLLALVPAIAIAVTVLAFNLVGNGLRDALDVKSQ